jgi:signal transduction histidine kinase
MSPSLRSVWNTATKDLFRRYQSAAAIVGARSPHVRIYEATISLLYSEELERIKRSGERVRDIHRSALEFARVKSGQFSCVHNLRTGLIYFHIY